MSGCRLSSAIGEARIAFGNDLTGMEMVVILASIIIRYHILV